MATSDGNATNYVADGPFLTSGSHKSPPTPRSASINKLWRIYTAATREIVPVSRARADALISVETNARNRVKLVLFRNVIYKDIRILVYENFYVYVVRVV